MNVSVPRSGTLQMPVPHVGAFVNVFAPRSGAVPMSLAYAAALWERHCSTLGHSVNVMVPH